MKLAVSNIAWENSEMVDHLRLLSELGCQGVELAPSAIWPEPVDVVSEESVRVKNLIHSFGLEITGFHSLLYTRPELQLFKDRAGLSSTVTYLKQLIRLCGEMEGKVLVFGSPRNRARNGKDNAECMSWAAEGFGEAARAAERWGVTLCIEHLAPTETDFIMSSNEGMELVRLVDHPNFGLHLDAKAMIEANEDFEKAFEEHGQHAKHFHVGDPGLAPPGSTGVDHAPMGRALRRSGYDGYVSIEMRRGFGPTREVVSTSVDYVKSHYLQSVV